MVSLIGHIGVDIAHALRRKLICFIKLVLNIIRTRLFDFLHICGIVLVILFTLFLGHSEELVNELLTGAVFVVKLHNARKQVI